jgi:hypothetical protein
MSPFLRIPLLAVLAFAACDSTTPPAVLTASSYAAIKFGMPLSDAESAAKEALAPSPATLDCTYVTFKTYPGIRFMVERGIVVRADLIDPLENGAGVKVGATIEQVRTAHPTAEVQPHKYEDDGHYLILPGAEPNSAYVFEAKAGRVTAIRAGIKPAVLYVEGCG